MHQARLMRPPNGSLGTHGCLTLRRPRGRPSGKTLDPVGPSPVQHLPVLCLCLFVYPRGVKGLKFGVVPVDVLWRRCGGGGGVSGRLMWRMDPLWCTQVVHSCVCVWAVLFPPSTACPGPPPTVHFLYCLLYKPLLATTTPLLPLKHPYKTSTQADALWMGTRKEGRPLACVCVSISSSLIPLCPPLCSMVCF